MNNIKINYDEILHTDPDDNIFTLRQKIYDNLIDKIYKYIDHLYDQLANDPKIVDISKRTVRSQINRESLMMMYKGIEIPMMDKSCLILDNIEYIPIFQMVDKCIHLQKDGKFVVVKNNVRNTFLKLDGRICNALYRNATIPLLPYLLYVYNDVRHMLTELGYTIIDTTKEYVNLDSNDYYIVPEYYTTDFLIVKKEFPDRSWKGYFLSPYTKEHFEYHQSIVNTIIDNINNNIIPQVTTDSTSSDNEDDIDNPYSNVVHSSVLDDKLQEARERRSSVEMRNVKQYLLIPHEKDQETIDKIFNVISTYHIRTRTIKRTLTKMYLETSLFKYNCEDITLNNCTVFGMISDAIKTNKMIPDSYNISDISQKDSRFMEWYALKLSTVRSYPEQNLITEVAKTEQKRLYNNSVNPITELAMMCRVNLFGKGALPLQSCNTTVRNIHDSYFGVVEPIHTPSGRNIGISLHFSPEVSSQDLHIETGKLAENNIMMRLYKLQDQDLEAGATSNDAIRSST